MNLYSSYNIVLESGNFVQSSRLVNKWYMYIVCYKKWPQKRESQEQSKVSRSRVVHAPPPKPLPSHPSPRLCFLQLGGGQDGLEAGDPVDEHRHPQVRLFDRTARPIITPHARLPYSMPRGVVPR